MSITYKNVSLPVEIIDKIKSMPDFVSNGASVPKYVAAMIDEKMQPAKTNPIAIVRRAKEWDLEEIIDLLNLLLEEVRSRLRN
jgi:hypothetical protein